ncbi:MFS transporter [Engelhardtia mirabilis]|uniref:Multidrug resistance protein 3 n=1 Tax=Engelhardtia mirabilis TaxID=2528011 RepID=A0A518BPX2_9BACT|nr:Multidrug resistance protein 3 [Planctomycetes bacterium Pla133]QDV03343.1 Multidrug resistance protein 3 [Planctomycetes bacterium Pla86]
MSPWRRTYWSVWFANLTAALGMMSFLPFFPSVVEELGADSLGEISLWSGLCFGAAPLMAGIMGPFWGAFGDRFGRKLMVLRSMLALCLFVGLMSLAQTPLQLLILRLGQGIFSGFLPPSITLVSVGVPRGKQGRVAGELQMAMAAGAILGPLLGGLMVDWLGLRSLFLVVSALTGLGAMLVALFAREQRTAAERAQAVDAKPGGLAALLQGLAGDLLALWRNPRTRAGLVLLFMTQLGIGATNPQLELFVRELIGGDPELSPQKLTGWVFTAMAVANLVAMPAWGRIGDRIGHLRALVIAAAASAVALTITAAATGYWGLLSLRVLLSLGAAAMGPCAFALAAAESPEHRRGASFGAVFSARTFAMALSAGLGGILAGWLTIRGLFLATGVVLLAASLFGLWIRSRHRARAAAA